MLKRYYKYFMVIKKKETRYNAKFTIQKILSIVF